MNDPAVVWTTAAPLWDGLTNLGADAVQFFRQPALLRFASDTFMDDFAAVLNSHPAGLRDFRAQPETWHGPLAAPAVAATPRLPKAVQKLSRARLAAQAPSARTALSARTTTATQTLKLYQPAHQRYYLVASALVCLLPGQPDRHIETGQQERASFVLRKVVPPAGVALADSHEGLWAEYAYVDNAWVQVTDKAALAANEEQQPLFAVNYEQDDGRRRRVLAGLIPVGKREAYVGAPERSSSRALVLDSQVPAPPDRRTLQFMGQVTEPWKRLIERAYTFKKLNAPLGAPFTEDEPLPAEALARALKDSREQMQTASWLALLDFAKLLRLYLPNVWESLTGQPLSSPLTTPQSALLTALAGTQIGDPYADALLADDVDADGVAHAVAPNTVIRNLYAALQEIQGGLPFDQAAAAALEAKLEAVVQPYDRSAAASAWPPFLFPLADPVQTGPTPPPRVGLAESADPLTRDLERVDGLVQLIEAALPTAGAQPVPSPLVAAQPVMRLDAPAYFVIRCVFERPNCGPLQPTVVSAPTEPFLMAGFFDPDAPARPIRIGLPVDTTPAGLRKFDKNTAFMISNVLCGQIDRAKALGLGDLIRTVLPFPLHKDLDVPDKGPCEDDGLALGMICSLSIPIITICALILLMIMVNLLDIIFRWVPYFILCLPLPKFNAKPNA